MEIQTVSIALAGIGIFIAAINFIVTGRKADQQRQMELFTQIYDHIVTDNFSQQFQEVMNRKVLDYDEWEQLRTSNPEVAAQEGYINRLIVYLCVVVNKELIDINLIDDLIAMPIIWYWDRMKPFYLEWRKRSHDPTLGDDIEAAYHTLKQRRDQQVALARQQQTTISS